MDFDSIVNEDSGDSILIVKHIIYGKILHSDVITIDVKFTVTVDTNTTLASGSGGFDAARCTLTNDTRNNDFWIVTVEDGHYLPAANTVYVKDSVSTKTNLGQDWYVEDDDVDLDYHLC